MDDVLPVSVRGDVSPEVEDAPSVVVEKLIPSSGLKGPDAFWDVKELARSCCLPGGSGAFRKRLAKPALMIPG